MSDDNKSPLMSSNRPYLVRAVYEWIVDNQMTPYLLVDASKPGVEVPASAVRDGKLVLNIASRAISGLELGNEFIRFRARFAGKSEALLIPVAAVQAIYAQESGQGMALPEEDPADLAGTADLVASDESRASEGPSLELVESKDHGPDDSDPPDKGPRRTSHLHIVK